MRGNAAGETVTAGKNAGLLLPPIRTWVCATESGSGCSESTGMHIVLKRYASVSSCYIMNMFVRRGPQSLAPEMLSAGIILHHQHQAICRKQVIAKNKEDFE